MLDFEMQGVSPLAGSHAFDEIYVKYYLFSFDRPIVFTFANAGENILSDDAEDGSSPWGFDFIKGLDVNVVSFACVDEPNWYRTPVLQKFFLHNFSFFKKFILRYGYGGSMGGFAAATFFSLLQLDSVLLINPISTLNLTCVPWENRFRYAQKLDWHSEYADAAMCFIKGFVVYDPLYTQDFKHANRLTGDLLHLKVHGVGHGMPGHLKSLGMLKGLVHDFIFGFIDPNEFSKKSRARRHLSRYYNWMLSPENRHLTEKREKVIRHYMRINSQ